MSSQARKLKRKARRAGRRTARRIEQGDLVSLREFSYRILPEGDFFRAFYALYPECTPLLLPQEDDRRGIFCIDCGNCLVREPSGEFSQGVMDVDRLFRNLEEAGIESTWIEFLER